MLIVFGTFVCIFALFLIVAVLCFVIIEKTGARTTSDWLGRSPPK